MSPLRYHELVDALCTIQNPTSPEKLDQLIEFLQVSEGDQIVDVGSGKGWLLRRLARDAAVHVVGLELSAVFAGQSRQALGGVRLRGSVEIIEGPALAYEAGEGAFDIALCIGATFALDGLQGTLAWMAHAVKPGGRIAVGEPFAKAPFPPRVSERYAEYDRTLADLVEGFTSHGFFPTGVIVSSEDDWDRYRSLGWRGALAWVKGHAGEAEAEEVRARVMEERRRYFEEERAVLGWAIITAERLP
ncbi:MAG: SAM-dependent methyltransferase [Caulobacteraceae bacterium]